MDVVGQYIAELGIKAEDGVEALLESMSRKFGRNEAEDYVSNLIGLRRSNPQLFYEEKNADYEKAMLFSGAFDEGILRSACSWLITRKEIFGPTILEIGCDCGFMTCFLGKMFPESKITSIDRGKNGIAIAKRNEQRLGIRNVEFLQTDVKKLKNRAFDTVFSMRTAPENAKKRPVDHIFDNWKLASEGYSHFFEAYARVLRGLTAEKGHVITVERLDKSSILLGWIKALNKAGIIADFDRLAFLEMPEISRPLDLSVIEGSLGERVSIEEIEKKWSAINSFDPAKSRWTDDEVLPALTGKAGRMIRGTRILGQHGEAVGQFACYNVINDPNHFLYLCDSGNSGKQLILFTKDEESDIIENYLAQIKHNKNSGLCAVKLA